MKLMVFAIDALPPDIVFENIHLFPNIKKLKEKGMYCEYDAYAYGYGSRDNWVSIYTGLTPKQHGIISNKYKDYDRYPNTNDYKDKLPFWNILGNNNVKVGMWKGLTTTPPQEINGYMISGEINYEADAEEQDEYTSLDPVVCSKDKNLLKLISGNVDKQPVPKSAEDLNCNWEQIKQNPNILNDILKDDYFKEAVDYLKDNLKYYEDNLLKVQKNVPVDVCFFYTQLIDYIGHFQLHDLKKTQMIRAIKIVDDFIGNIVKNINPDNVIILSDHGIKGWQEAFKNSSYELQKEMFGLRDSAIWLKNGAIVIEARNKGFLSSCHDIKGTFIISGKDIKVGKINEMRTVDIYPTLLEMFNINVPENREGFVLDVFKNKKILNDKKFISTCTLNKSKIAIIQNIDIPDFNRVVNEVFLNNRFSNITVLGEEKYKDTFICNSRIDEFISIDNKVLDKNILNKFDKVVVSYKNTMTREVDFYEIF